jgi:hypothetical protein
MRHAQLALLCVLITEPVIAAFHVLQMHASAADTVNSAEQKVSELRDKAADKAGEVRDCCTSYAAKTWMYCTALWWCSMIVF